MKKEKEIPVPGKNYYAWEYQEHTEVKHMVFQKYLKSWYTILSKDNKVNYFDCFGGCGVYTKDGTSFEPGSPILAAQAWEALNKPDRELNMVCFDNDTNTLENLKKVFGDYCPNMQEPWFINDDYDKGVNNILDRFEIDKLILAPSFFFIDPFGISLKYDTISRIISQKKSEILLNFMYNSVSRFLKKEKIESCFTELFGCETWKNCRCMDGKQKEDNIVDIYRNQLKKVAKYVMPYKISFPDKNRTYYYLVHLSNHELGVKIMKSCFASLNHGRVEYLGKIKDQLTVFDVEEHKEAEIKKLLIECYAGHKKTFENIIHEQIDATPYLEKHFRGAMKEMIKEGSATKRIVTSQSDKGLQGKDEITFH